MSTSVSKEEQNAMFFFKNNKPVSPDALFILKGLLLIAIILAGLISVFDFDEFKAKLDPSGHAKSVLLNVYENDCSCREGNLFLVDSSHLNPGKNKSVTPVCLIDNNIIGVPDCEFVGVINHG